MIESDESDECRAIRCLQEWMDRDGPVQLQREGLIERLEKATSDNRDLDIAIHVAVNGSDWIKPYYTKDVGAALTLVPAGWTWSVERTSDHSYCASVCSPTFSVASYDALNPAIAVCIAVLRARQIEV